MNESQLTSEQIDHLFRFVGSKNVRYIDVQHEIVDHLASDIEIKMKEDKSLSFEKALHQIYSKFPITGFAVMIDDKEKSIRKYWRKKLLFGLSWFLNPKPLLGISLMVASVFYLLSHFGSIAFIIIFLSIYSLVLLTIYKKWDQPYTQTENQKNYLFLDIHRYACSLKSMRFLIVFIPASFLELFTSIFMLSTFQLYYFSSIIIFSILIIYASIYIFPEILKEEIDDRYSHLIGKFSKKQS